MNADHRDANVLYVRAWGGIDTAVDATLKTISADYMTLDVLDDKGTEFKDIKIAFAPLIKDRQDLHRRLVSMVDLAHTVLNDAKK